MKRSTGMPFTVQEPLPPSTQSTPRKPIGFYDLGGLRCGGLGHEIREIRVPLIISSLVACGVLKLLTAEGAEDAERNQLVCLGVLCGQRLLDSKLDRRPGSQS
jgi:hypothetical protein